MAKKEKEVKTAAPVTFDPTKKYEWSRDTTFELSAGEFGVLLNNLRSVLSTQEAQNILLANQASLILEKVLKEGVETGKIKQKVD